MDRVTRSVASVILAVLGFVAALLFLTPSGCNDVGGVPSWERCTSMMGLPAFSVEDLGLDPTFNILIPAISGLAVGLLTWWLTGLAGRAARGAEEVTR